MKLKNGPLQRAGYDKDATSPFQQDQDPVLDPNSGTRIAAGLRDEFGTLVPEGDFTSGVTVYAKEPEKNQKVLKKFQQSLRDYYPIGNVSDDNAASQLKRAEVLKPELMADVKDGTLDQRMAGADKFYLKKMKIVQEKAKEHRAKQKN